MVGVTPHTVDHFEGLALRNPHLRAVVIPSLGGRVWELEDRLRQRQWIWHREGVALTPSAPGAAYDDVWAGGWEELFPNDAAGPFEGRDLPDHGEWWTLAWHVAGIEQGPSPALRLEAQSRILKASYAKEFRLAPDRPLLSVDYTIRSEEPAAFHFLFKQHLAVRLTPDCRLWLPGGRVHAVDPTFSTLVSGAGPFDWPRATGRQGQPVDLEPVPDAADRLREFLYVTDMPGAWCGVQDVRANASLRMTFDAATLPFLWLFLSYGGWRNTYTAVLEPCSNMPKDLAEAVRLGQSAKLGPGDVFHTRVAVTLGAVDGVDAGIPS